jgi:hypothetical protein
VSVGYDYAVTGGPLFASVLIPNALPQGDSNFILELPGFGNYSLVAGTTFNLLGVNPLGFSDFRISDIDPAEMLDPTNPTAFVTGLTFTAAGTVTVTQNPIIQNTGSVSVPEPSNLLGLGLLGFGAFLTGKLNKKKLVGLRQKTNREKPQPQSLLGIYFEKPKIAETQIDQGKS